VAGTGVSGAMAIASAFKEVERQTTTALQSMTSEVEDFGEGSTRNSFAVPEHTRVWERCIVVWSVREDDYVNLPIFEASPSSSLEVRIHHTGTGRKRMVPGDILDEILSSTRVNQSTWVYLSGPNAFIASGEEACKSRQTRGVDFYGARWDI
jgi:hypothetical protein